ncbi:helix-turn-helix transcriptional regulator, partial [Salmonella enterica]|nr:helix-turn-helix transcriptional regulator [Salmonella enterica]
KYEQLLEWIEKNLNKKITVSELSRKANCSERYLRVIFKKNMGLTPSEYIIKRKLTQAAFMLRETSRPVTDISLMFGFEHQTAFSRSFKKFTGKSPREYRLAEARDMKYFCPSKILKDVPCIVKFTNLNNINLSIVRKRILYLDFGLDFLIFKVNGLLMPRQDIHHMIQDFIFKYGDATEVIIYGDLSPGEGCDTILNIYAGIPVDSDSIEYDSISISEGDYICFTFTGTPEELMSYHAWARGHGLSKYGVTLRNSSSLTCFRAGPEPGVFICHYYIPCHLERQT